MPVTRVYRPIRPPSRAFMRMNDEWQELKVTAFIQQNGCDRNEVILPQGVTVFVANAGLEFDEPAEYNAYPHVGDSENLFQVYRDGNGQLYFKDDDGDWLYFEPDNPPRPDQVVQLTGDCYCNGGRGPIEVDRLVHDIPLGDVILGKTWEQIANTSHGV